MKKSKTINFTEGNMTKQLLLFVWPILLANFFQQVYNLTNSLIVGNYVSKTALSAISAAHPICLIFDYLFFGLGMGAGIVVAMYYGAKDYKKTREAIETSIIFAIIGGLLLTILSEMCLPFLMRITNVKLELYDMALKYLRVYVLGNSAVLTYQISFFILRSIGDSKSPLYYLIISCIINLGLGVLFVRGSIFNMPVVGTAWATIISQFVVDILCIRLLLHLDDELKIDVRHLSFNMDMTKRICSLGIPSGLQNMLIAISTIMIQSYINLFPNELIAGIGVAEKVAVFAHIPMHSVATVTVNMVSQNFGAGSFDRAREAIKKSVLICTVIAFVSSTILFVTSAFWVSLFNKDPLIIASGARMVRFVVYSFVPLSWSHVYHGAIRGAGNVNAPMIIGILTQCILRFVFVYIGLKLWFNVDIIYIGTAIGYASAGFVAAGYFHFSKWCKEAQLR